MRHVARVRLEQVRPQGEALLARRRLAQAIDHARHDARRGDVPVRLGDGAGAVVGPLGERLADAAIGREVEVREDADVLEARLRQPLEEGDVRRQHVGVVHRRLVPRDVRRVAAGQDRRKRARRVGRLGPGAAEVGAALRQRVERRRQRSPRRPPITGHAQPVGAEGVDGDDEDVALEGRARAGFARGRLHLGATAVAGAGGGGGGSGSVGSAVGHRVAALAVLVDAVAGNVVGARVDVGAGVVAVSAAEARGESVAVVIGQRARQRGAEAQPERTVAHRLPQRRRLRYARPDASATGSRLPRRRARSRSHDARTAGPAARRASCGTRTGRVRARARRRAPARRAVPGRAPASRPATARIPRRTRRRPAAPAAENRWRPSFPGAAAARRWGARGWDKARARRRPPAVTPAG